LGAAGENGIIGDNEFGGPVLLPRTEGVKATTTSHPGWVQPTTSLEPGRRPSGEYRAYLQGAYTGTLHHRHPGQTLVTSIIVHGQIPTGTAWPNATT